MCSLFIATAHDETISEGYNEAGQASLELEPDAGDPPPPDELLLSDAGDMACAFRKCCRSR